MQTQYRALSGANPVGLMVDRRESLDGCVIDRPA